MFPCFTDLDRRTCFTRTNFMKNQDNFVEIAFISGFALEENKNAYLDELKIFDKVVYNVWSYPIENKEKEIKSAVLYYRNITQEKFLTQQLMDADKMAEIGILAGSVAHEINNPLGGILAFSQIILRELKTEKFEKTQFHEDILEIEKSFIQISNSVERFDSLRMSELKMKLKFSLRIWILIIALFVLLISLSLYFDSEIVRGISSIRNNLLNDFFMGITFVSSILIIFLFLTLLFIKEKKSSIFENCCSDSHPLQFPPGNFVNIRI